MEYTLTIIAFSSKLLNGIQSFLFFHVKSQAIHDPLPSRTRGYKLLQIQHMSKDDFQILRVSRMGYHDMLGRK